MAQSLPSLLFPPPMTSLHLRSSLPSGLLYKNLSTQRKKTTARTHQSEVASKPSQKPRPAFMARQHKGSSWLAAAADTASWCFALSLVALLLVCSLAASGEQQRAGGGGRVVRGAALSARPCEEIYVVAADETLHSISDKCGDPYILEQNPHVHDPDDVFPGLVIKITPSKPRWMDI